MGIVRLLLAFAVVLSHLPPATFHFISGGLAVQAFFVVSGFYMALVLDGKYSDTRLFYTNRLFRLAPAYFAMMAIGLALLLALEMTATSSLDIFRSVFSNPASAAILLFENVFVVGQHWLYWFMIADDGSLYLDPKGGLPTETNAVAWQALVIPQSWSLSLELMFYAIAPWLVRRRTAVLVGITAASIAIRLAGNWLPVEYGLWQGRLFLPVLFLFLFGVLAYRLLPRIEALPRAAHTVALGALVAMIVLLPMSGLPAPVQVWTVYVGIAVGTPFAFALTRRNAIDRWVGELSYPIYLCHLLVVAGVLIYELPLPVWTAIGTTLLVSAFLMVLVERPVDRWRQKRVRAATA